MASFQTPGAASSPPVPRAFPLRQAMARRPLLAYILMAYAFSWILTIPFILWQWLDWPGTQAQWALVFVAKGFAGPFLAAYLMSRITGGKEGWRRLRQSVRQWRESWIWYAFALLAIPLAFLAGIAVLPGALSSFTGITPRVIIGYPIAFVLIALGGGPLAEEPSWRGYALPRLLEKYGKSRYAALKASLALGVIWTFWHLPDFLTLAQHGGPEAGLRPFYANLPTFFGMVMAMTIIFTWVYRRTHGSVFVAIILHASINTLSEVIPLFPVPSVQNTDLPMLIGMVALAAILLGFTRGQL